MTALIATRTLAVLSGLLLLGACSSNGPKVRAIADPGLNDPRFSDTTSQTGGEVRASTAAEKADVAALGVNAYLWRGALDTLSFMPFASADPFGGVIITDWYSPPGTSGERFKATAYILGRQLRSDGVRVSLFRQVLQDGQWTDATVNPSTATELEDKVLARARELRAAVK